MGGLGPSYRPDELLGLKVVVLTNLQPATIRGVGSEGMLLGAAWGQAIPALLTVDHSVPNGTPVRKAHRRTRSYACNNSQIAWQLWRIR